MTDDLYATDVLHELRVLGTPLTVFDRGDSWAASFITAELNTGGYGLEDLRLPPGAVVLDIGAHVGIVSAWLGLRFPQARLFSFEPCPRNFANLQRTLAASGVRNVTAINAAVSADGRGLALAAVAENSGGSHCVEAGVGPSGNSVPSIALLPWLDAQCIQHVDFLKIDCEGFEYELLTGSIVAKVRRLAGEFHGGHDGNAHALLEHCLKYLSAASMQVTLHIT